MNANAPDNVSKETTTVAKEQRTADVMKGEQQRGVKIVAELAELRPETSSARESSASYTNNRSSSLMDISQMLNNGINNVPEASTKTHVAETPTDFFFNAEFDENAVKCNMCVTKIFDHICTSCNSRLCSGCVGNHSCPCVNHSTLYMPEAIYYKEYAQKLYKKLCDVTKEKPKLTLNPEDNAAKNQYISNNPLNNSCESLSSSNEVSNSNSNISSSTVLSSVDDSAEVDRRLKVILEHTTNLIDICLESLREFQNEYNERLMSKYSHLTESSDEKSRELYRASNFIQKIVTNSVPSRLAADKDADSSPSSSQLNSKGAFLFLNSVEIINSYLKDSANVKAENIDIKKECQIFDIELCNLFKNKVQASLSPVNNSPISLFDKFKIPDKMSDMSVNEFTNVQFGHIYEPPGMSPKLNPFSLPLFSPGSTPDMYSLPHQTRGMISVMNNYSPHTAQIVDGIQFDSMGASHMNSFPNSISKSPSLQMKKDMINSNNSRIIANSANQPNELDNMKQQSEQINSGRHSSRKTLMQIRRKFGELGPAVGQFNSPHGFCIDAHGNILIADTNNHRILFFTKEGELFNYFGNPGKADGQIWYPRKIAVYGKEQNVIVCDRGSERSRMQIFSQHGEFIRRIAIRYVDIVASIAVHESPSGVQIIIVDSVSPTVYVICESGDILSWFDCSDYMKEPSDLVVYGEYFLICDFKGHRVCVFQRDGTYVTFFGSESVTNFPNGIDVLDNGNILVGDSHGNRFHVVIYNHNWQQINEFECPFVKVSRCCGLKVTPDGCIITLAKNNHHVLILNQIPYTISSISQQQQNQNYEMQMMSKQPAHLRSKPFNEKMETLTLQH